MARNNPPQGIAVIGIACRFPGAQNCEEFWTNLENGVNSITEIPTERWHLEDYYSRDPEQPNVSVSKWGGFIKDVDKFDAAFFNISPREAERMDPQQRLMLELTWTCIEDAGYAPSALMDKKVGVFIGACDYSYEEQLLQTGQPIEGHILSGNHASLLPNRISYQFNFHGPSVAVDTACSSSLVALHQAISALKSGDCQTALVGGASVFCTPTHFISLSKLGMLSPTGQCYAFDNAANGYVRGEGAGIVLLKPLAQALVDGDSIYGVIRGSAINHGGQSRTLTSPNVYAQSRVIRAAYQNANIPPETISFIETHGTGTPLGDPIEINGLKRAFSKLFQEQGINHSLESYCALGAVKTNIGHLEGAAGIAGLIKVLLMFQQGKLPKLANFTQQNTRIKLERSPFYLLTENQDWPRLKDDGNSFIPRRAGLSSFGFGGANAHVVLEEAPDNHLKLQDKWLEPPCYLLALSAKSEQSLRDIVAEYQNYIQDRVDLGDICFSTHTSREHLEYRLAFVASTSEQIYQQLSSWQNQESRSDFYKSEVIQKNKVIAILFTGQGAQYVNMARELYETQPAFRQTLEHCAQILNDYLDTPLLDVLYPEERTGHADALLHQTAYTQPALFAIEYALYQLWRSWGITPSVVMGHSIGELVAACVAGVFSLADGLKLSAMRGQLMSQLPSGGAMVSVMASVEQVRTIIKHAGRDNVSIAAINGPESIVISGDDSAVHAIAQQLESQGIKIKQLHVSHAFHSPLMAPMLAEFEQVVRQIHYSLPHLTLISNVTGQVISEEVATPAYWCDHILATVNFVAGMDALKQQNIDIFLECGPQPVLLAMGRQYLPQDDDILWLPSLRPGQHDWQQMLSSLGQLYIRGVDIDWLGFDNDYPQRRKVSLPTYPFQRKRYWIDIAKQQVSAASNESQVTELLAKGDVLQLSQLLSNPGQSTTATQTIEQLVKLHQQQVAAKSTHDLLYEVQWHPQEAPVINEHQPHHWLIFANPGELGCLIADQLRNRGQTSTLVNLVSAIPQRERQGSYELQPNNPDSYTQLWIHLSQTKALPVAGILWLPGLEEVSAVNLTTAVLDRTVNQQCGQLLYLIQSLVEQPQLAQTKLWIVTHNGVALGSDQPALIQAPVRGMSRIFGLEHPRQWGGLIDIDPQMGCSNAPTNALANTLIAEILGNQTEEQVCYRTVNHTITRYVARLVHRSDIHASSISITDDGCYLVSGGLGGLGLVVAQWLAKQGARSLVLLNRNGVNTPEKQAAIASLQSEGIQVFTPAVDIGDEDALNAMWEVLSPHLPPLRGVIHAAGIQGGPVDIAQLKPTMLQKTLHPKVIGTWNLHQLSLAYDLDFFVSFSSIASVWGAAQQAHYGAANEFLSLLNHHRHLQNLPGLTIHWSAIADVGMFSQAPTAVQQRLSQMGIQPLTLTQVIESLEQLLSSHNDSTVVANVDWTRFDAIYQTGRPRALLNDLVQSTSDKIALSPHTLLFDELKTLPYSEQVDKLQKTIQQEVGKILGHGTDQLPNPTIGFFELGMDSLMAVELQTRLTQKLGTTLSSTVAFDFPNIKQLSHHLNTNVLHLTPDSKGRASVSQQRQTLDEPIAIVGIGCRLPGGIESPEQFWQLLQAGQDARREIPVERWDIDAYYDPDPEAAGKMRTRYGHFIEGVDQFDPSFFGISPREAIAMDPQHRLLLEVSWEALERAGQKLERLSEAVVGVFVGNDGHDYEQLLQQHLQQSPESPLATYGGTGNHISSAAGRLAYTLGFTGPTITLDTACSSSLVAVHQACNSLRLGECQMALAGGVKLHLTPDSYISTSKAQMISADGRCKTFDESADGYGRGEGCGLIVLKRLRDAERDRDPILALIRGSAVNQDGPSSGLTVPNGQAQQRLIKQALVQAHVQPHEVSYLEAHGTGTSLGDPIEVNAAMAVLGKERSGTHPLWLGSVKTNIGHLEAAAGISGLIKVVLSLQHQQIPAHLHLQSPNPKIDWQPWLQVPQKLTPWASQERRLAGVSSFGFTGTNAHVVLEAAPMATDLPQITTERPLQVLAISAKTADSLTELAQRYCDYLQRHPELLLTDVCFSASTGRLTQAHRLAVVADNSTTMAEQLSAFATGQMGQQVNGVLKNTKTPKVAMVFTGQGAQYINMARALYKTQPTFRQTLEHCNEILNDYLDSSLLEVLYPDERTEQAKTLLHQTAYTQPALFAIEYGLYQLWQSWGIMPTVVMGHSIGELVAACVAGVFSLEDGLKLSAMRGKLMGQLPSGGTMISIMASAEQVRPLIAARDNVTIAAINGPESTVISGAEDAVQAMAEKFEVQGVKTKQLSVSHAFHSPLMQPMLAEFEQVARQIRYSVPQLKLISNVTGQVVTEQVTTPDYWCRHILTLVNFAAGMERLQQEEIDILLECGPQPILLGMARQCWSLADNDKTAWLPSLRQGQNDWQQLLSSLSELYIRGVTIDWLSFEADYGQRRKVSLPTYPFQRQRYWIDVAKKPILSGQVYHTLVGSKVELASTEQTLYHQTINLSQHPWIDDHRVYNTAVIPGVSYIAMALATLELPATIDAISFLEPLFLAPTSARETQLVIEPVVGEDNRRVDVFSRDAVQQDEWRQHASLTVQNNLQPLASLSVNLASLKEQLTSIATDTLTALYNNLSITYGPMLAAVQQAWVGDGVALSEIVVPELLAAQLSGEPIHPVLLDACTRLTPDLFAFNDEPGMFWAPWQAERVTLVRPAPRHFYAYVNHPPRNNDQLQTRTYDIHLLDDTGYAFGRIDGFTLKRAPQERFLKYLQVDTHQWLYQLQWQHSTLQSTAALPAAGTWLLLVPTEAWAKQLKEALIQQQQSCVVVSIGETFQQLDEYHYQVCLTQEDGFEQLLQQLNEQNITLQGIVHLWSLTSDLGNLTESLQITCGSTLQLLQALTSREQAPVLWLVTQSCQSVGREQETQIQQTSLWGLGRVIALEHPELNCRLLDLDATSAIAEAVPILVQELLNADAENLIAYHQTQRHVARLQPYAAGAAPASRDKAFVHPDASYLITGGLGALGLQVAQWLGQSGATSLVLMGRRAPSEAADAIIHDLMQAGVHVSVVQADVANAAAVATVLDEIDAQLPPLKGIIHAAGVLADGLLQNQNWSQFEQVMAAKVLGSWHLHQLTQDKPLDFFVCFSSAASLVGVSGQGNYAAANAFMDGLAHYRCSQGLPGLSINWGPWAGDGMTAQLSNPQMRRFEQAGFQLIDVEVGLSGLQQCLQLGAPQVGVLPINWSKWSTQGAARTPIPLIKALLPASAQPSETGWLLRQLESTPIEQRQVVLMEQLRSQVAQVLGLLDATTLDAHTGLFDLGIDSLMVTELRNRLQSSLSCRLSATDLFNYNTLDDLVHYLVHEVFQWDEITLEHQIQPTDEAFTIGMTEIENMDLDELNACISEELEELETL